MGILSKIGRSLTRTPLGMNADGGRIGVGLASALDRSERNLPGDVEDFLRRQNGGEERHTTASSDSRS